MREIGVAALPAFDERGSLITPPSSALRPFAFTNAVAAMRLANGQTRIWRGRTQYTPDAGCSGATLHRVDHDGSSLLERYLVDLTSALVRTCIDALAAFTAPARTGDAAGSQALIIAGACQDQPGGRAYVCLTRVLDTGSALVIDRAWASNGLAVFGSSGTADMFVTGVALDAAGGAWVAANRSVTGDDAAAFLIHFGPDGAIDATLGTGGGLAILGGTLTLARSVAVTANGIVLVTGGSSGASGNGRTSTITFPRRRFRSSRASNSSSASRTTRSRCTRALRRSRPTARSSPAPRTRMRPRRTRSSRDSRATGRRSTCSSSTTRPSIISS
jgi:hypothetical protein